MSSKVKTTKKRWKPTIGAPLGPQEAKIVTKLKTGGASVYVLFRTIGGNVALLDARQQQQKIGAVVSRLNRKLKGRRVVVGTEAGTYRLRRVR